LIKYPNKAIAKPRMTRADTWKKRPIVLRYWDYKDDIKNWGVQNKFTLKSEIYVKFYIPMPPSWSKKKRESHLNTFHIQRPDVDNLLKGLMDAFLEEDSHVHTVYAQKYWGDEGSIEFYELENIILF
jgi:Holliday junction resolvase RusA-like endonuclease|tara:strand:- start:1129 stop:1509 length:381 start_codon:yes stop_codon:yes gene_type:complete